MTQLTITATDGGSFGAYVARPEGGSGPGLLVIQEIFGVNAVMRHIADNFARAGYVAVVPDLFWRLEPGVQLVDEGADLAKAFDFFGRFDEAKGMADLTATLAALRILEGVGDRVGTVGYCLGGRLAYLMATRSDADCNVSYYGVGIENNLYELINVRRPLLLHIAENDQFVNPLARAQILQEAAGYPQVEAYVYPGVGHAFARLGGTTFEPGAAAIADRRSLDFLARHLKGA